MKTVKSRSSRCDKNVGELDPYGGGRLGNAVRASSVGVLVASPLPAGGASPCTSTSPMSEIYFLSPRGSRWQKLSLLFPSPLVLPPHTVLDVGWFLQLLGGVFLAQKPSSPRKVYRHGVPLSYRYPPTLLSSLRSALTSCLPSVCVVGTPAVPL